MPRQTSLKSATATPLYPRLCTPACAASGPVTLAAEYHYAAVVVVAVVVVATLPIAASRQFQSGIKPLPQPRLRAMRSLLRGLKPTSDVRVGGWRVGGGWTDQSATLYPHPQSRSRAAPEQRSRIACFVRFVVSARSQNFRPILENLPKSTQEGCYDAEAVSWGRRLGIREQRTSTAGSLWLLASIRFLPTLLAIRH